MTLTPKPLKSALGDFRRCALLARKWKDRQDLSMIRINTNQAQIMAADCLHPLCTEILAIIDLESPLPAAVEQDPDAVAALDFCGNQDETVARLVPLSKQLRIKPAPSEERHGQRLPEEVKQS